MTPARARVVAVPDLDGELLRPLVAAEEVLLALAAREEGEPGAGSLSAPLPEPVARGQALAAVQRLYAALQPTQGLYERHPDRGRVLAPERRYEHMPVTFVAVDDEDLQAASAVARALGDPAAGPDLAEAADEMAQAHGMTRSELVQSLARTAGVLDLEWAPEMQLLHARLATAPPGADVVLNEAEEAAYQATADRLNGMWALGSDVDRILY